MRKTTKPRVPVQGKQASKPPTIKTVGVTAVGETSSLTGEFIGETHRFLGCTQNHPPGNQHQKDPICFWVAEEVTENGQRAEQAELFPHRRLPHIQHHKAAKWVTLPW